MEEQEQDQPMEVDYESDGDTVSIVTSITLEDDTMDDGNNDVTQQTLTIHLVQQADGTWTRTIT